MGNLFNQSASTRNLDRAPMLRSVFEFRQLSKGMQHLSCDVVFGLPSEDCMGTGICRISALKEMPLQYKKERTCESAPAILYPLEGGSGVSMIFPREMMCIKLLRSQFRGNMLTLNEPCTLPKDVVRALSLTYKELKPGNYPVLEADGFFRIHFR